MQHEITIDEQHIYRVAGAVMPGYSEISKAMGLVHYWNRDPWYMERGNIVHKETLKLDNNELDWDTLDPRVKGFIEAYQVFKEESGITFDHGERMFHCPTYRYCGTIDRFLPLLDIKTGQGDTLQLEAYAHLLEVNGYPKQTKGYILNLNENGTFKLEPYKFDRTRRSIWLSAVIVYWYRKLKGLL
jgi:hypothetical protein